MSALKYRPEIDGLRFVAVLPVVLYHAGIPGFSGGFVGVDIFFVISGYLITAILLGEMNRGEFDIVRFYERRIRRIFPALFALIAFVCLVSPFALLPSELRALPREVIGALAFIANIVFWRHTDYFSTGAEEKPLLHTWSLGVEEQFYIFVPIFLWLLVRYTKRWLLPALVATLALSLALCVYLTPIDAKSSFYLLPTRAWELLAGSVLAAGLPRMRRASFNEAASVLGLACLLIAIFTFDEHTEFPGYAAALPVIGACLLIQFSQGTAVGSLLASRPTVFIGLISYSLYLWHWPLVVFFRDWGLLVHPAGRIGVVALSFVAAWASWKFIETPFRNAVEWPRARIFKSAFAGGGLLVAAAGVLFLTNGWPSRFSPQAIAMDDARNDFSPERKKCHPGSGDPDFEDLCRLGANGSEPATVVWADSHGVELAAALAETGLPVIQATYSQCPPSNGYVNEARPECTMHNDKMLRSIERDPRIQNVIIAANYPLYTGDDFWTGLRRSLDRLSAANKRVFIIGPFPDFDGINVPSHLAAGREPHLETQPAPRQFSALPSSNVVSVRDHFCRGTTCTLSVNGKPVLYDDNHISMAAARAVSPSIVRAVSSQTGLTTPGSQPRNGAATNS